MHTCKFDAHYENTPFQIYWKIDLQKLKKIQIKNSDISHVSTQNIDYGYSLDLSQGVYTVFTLFVRPSAHLLRFGFWACRI